MCRSGLLVRLDKYGEKTLILKIQLFFLFNSIFSAVFGPKLGMRAMVQCRFSWGYEFYFILLLIFIDVWSEFELRLLFFCC